jgi:uncharacterized repeat protein (TIGR01451 family)/fimbrial isopeptide formation D2 family protein
LSLRIAHSDRPQLIFARASFLIAMLLLALGAAVSSIQAQVCANPGKDGPGGTLGGVVNTYYPGSATANAGATSISIGSSTGSATAIASGDLLLVIQMQDAQANWTNSDSYGDGTGGGNASGYTSLANAGKYEFVVATSAAGATVSIRGAGSGNGLVNTYTNAAASGSRGARRFQVVRVPQYSSATLGSTLTASPWNGSTGGILAIDVAGNLALGSATVSVDSKGFRGGGTRQLAGGSGGANTDYRNVASSNYHGGKGEGVAGTPRYVYDSTTDTVVDTTVEGYPNGSTARGAPGNAGGGGTDGNPTTNDQNSGGGGGGNGGAGGLGGNTWSSNLARGGYGGVAIPDAAALIVLGGGGGGGSRNNSAGTASSGGTGGGIVLITAGTISGSGTISANGADGNDADNDGGGGGGAGGSVVVVASTGGLGSLSINARGGKGGDAWPGELPNGTPGDRHGPGGGGGGGFIAINGSASTSISGGTNGITTTASDAYGATSGSNGVLLSIALTDLPGADSGSQCVPSLTTTKTTSTPSLTNTPTGVTATYAITIANAANRSSASNLIISDTLPTGFTFNSTGTVTLSGGATRPSTSNPTVGDAVPNWGTFTIPGGGSIVLNFTAKVAYTAAGTFQNPATATYTDPARTVANGTTTSSYNSASSTGEDVTVVGGPNVGLVKSVSPTGTQNPGTDLVYTITFTNTGGASAQSLVIKDPVPANTDFKVGSVTNSLGTTGLTVAVAYSNDGGTTWSYTPVSAGGGAAAGYDRNVTNIRWTFTGNLSKTPPNNTGSVNFTAKIR